MPHFCAFLGSAVRAAPWKQDADSLVRMFYIPACHDVGKSRAEAPVGKAPANCETLHLVLWNTVLKFGVSNVEGRSPPVHHDERHSCSGGRAPLGLSPIEIRSFERGWLVSVGKHEH